MSNGFFESVILVNRYKDELGRPIAEFEDMDTAPDEERSRWYQSFCNDDDLRRILHPQNGYDYILKLNANYVAFNTRLLRFFMHLSRIGGKDWSFANYFHSYNYIEFQHMLDEKRRKRCKEIAYGTVFTEDPNGCIFSSPFGLCTVCSTSLKWLSHFSTLSLLYYGDRVPRDVQWRSMIIATRLALGCESYDFEMDPRGIIPSDIRQKIYRPYPFQSVFIAGHEYAHYLLGHLNRGIKAKQEFEADIFAMNEPKMEATYYNRYYHSVMLWFAAQIIFEAVRDNIYPQTKTSSHPSAKARYENILVNAHRPLSFSIKYYGEDLLNLANTYSEKLLWLASKDENVFKLYGSYYLAEPNTEWRGRELIDRVDY